MPGDVLGAAKHLAKWTQSLSSILSKSAQPRGGIGKMEVAKIDPGRGKSTYKA